MSIGDIKFLWELFNVSVIKKKLNYDFKTNSYTVHFLFSLSH